MQIKSKISNFSFDESRFAKCKIDVAHDQGNLNNTWFDADVLQRCANESLHCVPLLANVYKDEDGEYHVGSHDMEMNLIDTPDGYDLDVYFLEKPVGFVPPDAPIEMVYNPEDQRNHLYTYGVIWTKYAQQLMDYIDTRDGELAVSMEIECKDTKVAPETGDIIISDFTFNGITLLGDAQPAMEGAHIKTFSMNDMKNEIEEMIKVYSAELEGGESVEENKEVVEVEEQQTEEVEQQEVVVTQEVTETVEVDGEVVEETVETVENKEVVEPEPVEEVAEEGDDFDCKKKKYEELEEEYATLKETYETLQGAYAELEEKLNAMSDYEELKAFKENYDKVAYENEVEEVAQMFSLDASDVKELKEKALAKEITIEQFREKLGYKFAMKQLSKPAKQEHSSEAAILDDEEISNAPYGGYFEKYRNR